MADEITYGFTFTVDKTGIEPVDRRPSPQQMDLSGTDTSGGSQVLSTSEEALRLGDVTPGGWLLLKNHDASATVHLRPASGETNCVSWLPGEEFPVRLATGSTPYLIASAGTPRVSYVLLDA